MKISRSIRALVLAGLAGCLRASGKSEADRIAQYGDAVKARLAPAFAAAGVPYPPARMTLVGLKQERRLELYAAGRTGDFRLVKSYPILAASGGQGPKLREGDGQVPEGLYRIESLNPNSLFHLSLRVSYPNAFDRAQGARDGRKSLGGDIMIHGGAASIGCLAMGDPAAEELFVTASRTGLKNIQVILSPVDFRVASPAPPAPGTRPWVPSLYEQIKAALKKLPLPPAPPASSSKS